MAPSFANMPPRRRAAFIRAQLDSLLDTSVVPAPDLSISLATESDRLAVTAEPPPAPPPVQHPAKTPKRGRPPKPITSAQAPHPAPDPERHARKCSICNHPERDAIDAAFLQWRSGEWIAFNFEIANRRFIYRRAHATGLFNRRRLNFRCSLENILERGDQINLTAAGFVSAIRAYASLDDAGRWNDPVRRSIVTNEYVQRAAPESHTSTPAESPKSPVSNEQFRRLETDLTSTK